MDGWVLHKLCNGTGRRPASDITSNTSTGVNCWCLGGLTPTDMLIESLVDVYEQDPDMPHHLKTESIRRMRLTLIAYERQRQNIGASLGPRRRRQSVVQAEAAAEGG